MQLKENILFHDRYRLVRLLGQGGFSEVWLAEDTKAGMTVALKVYAPGKGLDEDGIELFGREFSLVFNFNHSNLLRPSHYDVCECMPYLIMPFCGRGSAKRLTGGLGEEEAWTFLHDVAAGLAYLHSRHPDPVIHQDIKPDNVLIDDAGQYLITDFGVSAKARSTLRKSVGIASGGTVAYMSPERFGRDKTPIMASDIWALGATLYELFTDDAPFGEHGGILQKSGAEIPEIQADCSSELKQVVECCLSLNAWERPTAETLVEWMEQHKCGEKIQFGKKPTNPSEPPKPHSGTKWRNITITVAICAVLGIAVIGIVSVQQVEKVKVQAETDRVARAKVEVDKQAEADRVARAKVEADKQAEADRATRAKAEADRQAKEKAEADGIKRQQQQNAAPKRLEQNPTSSGTPSTSSGKADYDKGKEYYKEKNYADAVIWFRKSAEQGYATAQNWLGHMYSNGYGVTKDYAEAAKWYRKSAEQGDATGQNWLGRMYYEGDGVTKDYAEAAKWYRKSAEQGDKFAQCNLGEMYFYGEGVTEDDKEAIKWYLKSAEQGNSTAQSHLGYIYYTGTGVTSDCPKAVMWYRKSAEQNDSYAQYALGLMYEIGCGVTKDSEEAMKWYRKSAEQREGDAQRAIEHPGEPKNISKYKTKQYTW
jgi:TPR repeat protein/serine/threonine protein kinase